MIELETTLDTVVMLLVAGGVGLLGGVGAGLIETRRSSQDSPKAWWGTVGASIALGGIAAVAVLYFFPPEETATVTVDGVTETTVQYNLTKLVALALIVGSAGSSFLVVLQTRALALSSAERAEATQATASEALDGVGAQAPTLAKSGIEATAPTVQRALEDARAGGAVTPDQVAKLVGELSDQTEQSVRASIDPVVRGAQATVRASSKTPSPEENEK